jgi:hypothetical protein
MTKPIAKPSRLKMGRVIAEKSTVESAELAQQEEFDYQNKRNKLALSKEAQPVHDAEQDRVQRKYFAWLIYGLIVVWLTAIFVVLFFQGFGAIDKSFVLSEPVLLALIGGTTINVLGIFILVAKYLFTKSD